MFVPLNTVGLVAAATDLASSFMPAPEILSAISVTLRRESLEPLIRQAGMPVFDVLQNKN